MTSSNPNQALLEADVADAMAPVSVRWWSVNVSDVFSNADLRLDAQRYDPIVYDAIHALRESGVELAPLSSLASVELRSQFTRVWARDSSHGLPYLNATDLLSLFALGAPAGGHRYLSRASATDVDSLVIREGWLLMTCSGTIGRVFYVSERLDGWAATHDLVRIIPNEPGMAGYLYAWLSAPAAQHQILSHTHGGQIDHVTDAQVSSVLVPVLPQSQIARIDADVMEAFRTREQAMGVLMNAWPAK